MLIQLFLLLVLGLPYDSSTRGDSVVKSEAAYEGVLKAESSWENANFHHDDAALTKVLLQAFVQINEDGSVTTRDEAIAKLRASGNRPKQYKVENRRIQILADSAFLTAEYTEVGQSPKGYYRVVFKIADVFRYSQGAWKGEVGYAHLVDLKSGESSSLSLNER